MLLPDITLYFPLPVIFYVNIHEPRMAERLEAGLKQARQDGSFERLFRASFADEIQLVRDGSVRQFMLVNPFAPKDLAMTRLLEPIAPANSPSAPPRFKAGRLGVEAGLDPPRQWGGQVWTGRASR
jgi:hypothetical protein